MSQPEPKGPERRRHRRFTLGLPVRLHTGEGTKPTTIELSDVSLRGCRLGALPDELRAPVNARVAFGFVLPGNRIALAKGRVVRRFTDAAGEGLGLAIERANVAYYEFLLAVSQGDAVVAA